MNQQPLINTQGIIEFPRRLVGIPRWSVLPRPDRIWHWLTEPAATLPDPEQRRLARLLASLLVFLIPLGVLATAVQLLTNGRFRQTLPITLAGFTACVAAYLLSRTRHYGLAAIITVFLPSLVTFAFQIVIPDNAFIFAFTAISVLLGSMLLPNRWMMILSGANIGGMLLFPAAIPSWTLSSASARFSFVVIVTGLSLAFVRYRDRLEEHRLLERMASEERYRSLFDRVPVGLYRALPDGRVVDANPALAAMLGYANSQALLSEAGHSLFVSPQEYDAWRAQLESHGFVRGHEMQLRRADGTLIWVRDNARAVRDPAGRVCHYEGSLEDVTERKNAEQAEREQRDLAETLRDLTLILTSRMDLQGVLAEIVHQAGRLVPYTAANIALLEADKLRIAHLEGYPSSISERLATPERRLDALPLDQKAIQLQQPVIVPDTAQDVSWKRLGSTRWRSYISVPIILQDQVLGLLRLNGDAPHQFCRAHAERLMPLANAAAIALGNAQLYEDARERAAQFELVAQTGRQTTAILDLDQLLQQTVELLSETFGYYSAHVALIVQEHVVLCAASHASLKPLVGKLRLTIGKEGVMGWVATSGEPLLVPDVTKDPRYLSLDEANHTRSELAVPIQIKGRVIGVLDIQSTQRDAFSYKDVYTLQPIADQLAIAIENARLFAQEEERAKQLSRTLEQQRELDRLRTELVQNVSHELRTPVAIARGYAEMLQSGALGDLSPEQQGPMDIIVQRIQALSRMMEDISAVLDVETRQLSQESVDLARLVQETAQDVRFAVAEKELALTLRLPRGIPPVVGDPAHLRRVVDNLVANAIKFTPTGGAITVRLRNGGASVKLEVADTGVGIPQEQLSKIFQRFYQVDGSSTRRYSGTGLGLALVDQIVKAHGGQISVQSSVGQGSVFCVALPVAHSAL